MPFQPLDIVMLRPELGAKIFAILEIKPSRLAVEYLAVKLDKGPLTRRYRLREDQILVKIGTLDAQALQVAGATFAFPQPENWQEGQYFARFMSQHVPLEMDRRRWAFLAQLKPGECVPILQYSRSGTRVEHHRFLEVLPTGQKYHFTAVNANGTVYRWTLDSLYLPREGNQESQTGSSEGPPPQS